MAGLNRQKFRLEALARRQSGERARVGLAMCRRTTGCAIAKLITWPSLWNRALSGEDKRTGTGYLVFARILAGDKFSTVPAADSVSVIAAATTQIAALISKPGA